MPEQQPVSSETSPTALPADQQPTPDVGVPLEGPRGVVTVQLDATSYNSGSIIAATIGNGLDQTIYTEDMKSDCSIFTLEQWDGTAWQPIPACTMRRAPTVIVIGPGFGQTAALDLASAHFADAAGSAGAGLAAGTYRMMASYRLSPEPQGEAPFTVYSEPFTIETP